MTQEKAHYHGSDRALYQPLVLERKEIRLLELKAGRSAAPLICTLSTVSLLDNPRTIYETISYCWGDASKRGIISVNDMEIEVPSSAKNALLCLRYASQDRTLWIDAVCINQQDLNDRAQQVSIMGDVYFSGQRCLIYLGEDDGIAHEASKAIKIVIDDAREKTDNFRTWQETIADNDRMETRSQNPPLCRPDWDVLKEFYGRPWFRRLWIVQEVALSPEGLCYCGEVQFPLLDVLRAATWVTYYGYFVPKGLRTKISSLGPIADLADHKFGWSIRGKDKAPTLTYLLELARHYETTDSRDKIYATLGLTKWTLRGKPLPSSLVPDYQKGLHEILRDVTKFIIQTDSRLDFYSGINFGWDDEYIDKEIPSWVPRWDQSKTNQIHVYHFASFFDACDNTRIWLDIDDSEPNEGCVGQNSNVLPFVGLYIDTVSGTSCVYDETNNSGEDLANALDFFDDIENLMGDLATAGRALIASRNWYGENATPGDVEEFSACLHFMETFHVAPRGPPRVPSDATIEEKAASRYWNALWIACLNRRFFITRNGRHGLGPSEMLNGDVVAVLYGGKWPFVLRPVGDKYYRMIGICYVEGIMFGEAVRKTQANDGESEVFNVI